MKQFTLRQIASSCNGKFAGYIDLDTSVSAIVTDSRKIVKGALFAAIKGAKADGHNFIEDSVSNGAVCVLCERAPEHEGIPYILVQSTLDAIKQIAEAYRALFQIPIIGVTGSVGKTSTKEMLFSVLSQKYNVHKTEGNFNNELGVPLTLFGLEDYHQAAVIEMGISDFGEMKRLSKIVKPEFCVITNIGFCHLEQLKDRDGVLKAKSEIFEFMNKEGKVFLNGDDDKLRTIKEVYKKRPIFFGFSEHCDYRAEPIENLGLCGYRSRIHFPGGSFITDIPVIGKDMILNALVSIAIGHELNMSDETIIKGITECKPIGGRSNIIKTKTATIIDDCYNANPTSVKAAIDMLTNISQKRSVCILGDMKELGTFEADLHSDIGIYAAKQNVDLLIAIGPLAYHIYEAFKEINQNSYAFDTIQESLPYLKDLLMPGDTILIKASRSMKFEEIISYIL